MQGIFGFALGGLALTFGLAGAGLRVLPRPGWGRPRFPGLSLRLYALQLFVWSLAHRGDARALGEDRQSSDARARAVLRRLHHPGVAELDDVQALASAYWLIVAALGAGLLGIEAIRALWAG